MVQNVEAFSEGLHHSVFDPVAHRLDERGREPDVELPRSHSDGAGGEEIILIGCQTGNGLRECSGLKAESNIGGPG